MVAVHFLHILYDYALHLQHIPKGRVGYEDFSGLVHVSVFPAIITAVSGWLSINEQ